MSKTKTESSMRPHCRFCNSNSHWTIVCTKDDMFLKPFLETVPTTDHGIKAQNKLTLKKMCLYICRKYPMGKRTTRVTSPDGKLKHNMVSYPANQLVLFGGNAFLNDEVERTMTVNYYYPNLGLGLSGGNRFKNPLLEAATHMWFDSESRKHKGNRMRIEEVENIVMKRFSKATKHQLASFIKAHFDGMVRSNWGVRVRKSLLNCIREKDHCPICMEEFHEDSRTATTHCGHTFCTRCFVKHVQSGSIASKSCPMCRQNLTPGSLTERRNQMEDHTPLMYP